MTMHVNNMCGILSDIKQQDVYMFTYLYSGINKLEPKLKLN